MKKPLVVFSVFCIIGIGLGFSCGNFVFLAKALVELTGLPMRSIGIIIYATLFSMLLIIREPERIKPIAFFFTAVILSIGKTSSSAIILMLANYITFIFMPDRTNQLRYNYSELDASGMLVGIALYSFESINTVANVRRTTQVPSEMRFYVKVTFFSASAFYILFAASYHLAYGSGTMRKIAFDYYTTSSSFLHALKYLVMLNPLFSIPFNVITTVELFEKLRPLSFLTRDRAMNLSAGRILLTRQAALAIVFCLSSLSQDISIILNTVGSLFGPALGLLVPVLFAHQVIIYLNFTAHHGIAYSRLWRCHDYVYLTFAVLLMLLGFKTVYSHFS